MIDICDFAVGLSRQLHGLTIASERPGHRLMETWHPMGPCAVITAFNFPVAVWSWNAALALVAGDPVLWKPSDKTPLTALACDALLPTGRHRGRCPARSQSGAARRCRRRRRPRRPPGRRHRVGDRVDEDGPCRCPDRRRALRSADPRARRQQRRHRRSHRRPRPRRPRHRLLGRRHGRAALHEPAPPHRPRFRARRARRSSRQGLRHGADRRPAGRRHAGRAVDRRCCVRQRHGGDRHGDRPRRRRSSSVASGNSPTRPATPTTSPRPW